VHETTTDTQVKWTLIHQRREATFKKLGRNKKLESRVFKKNKLLQK
jgi:hypothetical protein